ncbi:MAG TPA: hypothetical protein VF441_05975 [Acidimicrobiia bacterium]
MEDRITPGLYLEMCDHTPTEYAATRVPEVLTLDRVERATWWENTSPGRTDLPRRIPEFTLLGVYETDPDFGPPTTPTGVTGYHFRHFPRPGQGRLCDRPTLGLLFVLISPREPAQAAALRDWSDFVHIHQIAEAGIPHYTMITPYENVTGADPRFLHLYEMDTDDPEPAFRAMTPRVIKQIGKPGTTGFDKWATTPELQIVYVNTFRRLGEARP